MRQERRPQKRATDTLRARIAARRQQEADAARAAAAAEEAGEDAGDYGEDEDGEAMGPSISRLPQGLQNALMAFAQVQKAEELSLLSKFGATAVEE